MAEGTTRHLIWVARYNKRLIYIPHENIELIISNLDYQGNPIPGAPIRIYRMTRENEATYIDIDPREDTMAELIARTVDMGGIVEDIEATRRQQAEVYQQRLEQAGQAQPQQGYTETVPVQQVPNGERTKAMFPDVIPPDREEVAVMEADSWDNDGVQLQGAVTEQAAQDLIEEVTPGPPPTPPKADRVRRRNGNRR